MRQFLTPRDQKASTAQARTERKRESEGESGREKRTEEGSAKGGKETRTQLQTLRHEIYLDWGWVKI